MIARRPRPVTVTRVSTYWVAVSNDVWSSTARARNEFFPTSHWQYGYVGVACPTGPPNSFEICDRLSNSQAILVASLPSEPSSTRTRCGGGRRCAGVDEGDTVDDSCVVPVAGFVSFVHVSLERGVQAD